MANDQLLLTALLAVNGASYTFLLVGALRRKRHQPVTTATLAEAFQMLENAIKQNSDLPSGFTWGEAFQRLQTGSKFDLKKMEAALRVYEAFRYGGREPSGTEDYTEVVRTAYALGGASRGNRP